MHDGVYCANLLARLFAILLCMSVSYLFPPEEAGLADDDIVLTGPAVKAASRPKRNTKAIGDLSEAIVIAKLIEHGYLVSIPFGENHRYDIVADDGTAMLRIQVKTGRLKNGIIDYACYSSHQHRRSGPTATRPYFGQIEFLAIYCPLNGKVYLVPDSELVATRAHLRIAPPKNKQVRHIRWASRYELA